MRSIHRVTSVECTRTRLARDSTETTCDQWPHTQAAGNSFGTVWSMPAIMNTIENVNYTSRKIEKAMFFGRMKGDKISKFKPFSPKCQ